MLGHPSLSVVNHDAPDEPEPRKAADEFNPLLQLHC